MVTDSEWTILLDDSVDMLSKREVICGRATKLGCRCPCEHTSKWLTSLMLVCSYASTELTAMSTVSKHQAKESLKTELKQMARRMMAPEVFLKKLHNTAAELSANQPQLYALAYSQGEGPVNCKLDVRTIASVDASYKCRGGGGVGSMQKPGTQLLEEWRPQPGVIAAWTSLSVTW